MGVQPCKQQRQTRQSMGEVWAGLLASAPPLSFPPLPPALLPASGGVGPPAPPVHRTGRWGWGRAHGARGRSSLAAALQGGMGLDAGLGLLPLPPPCRQRLRGQTWWARPAAQSQLRGWVHRARSRAAAVLALCRWPCPPGTPSPTPQSFLMATG